MITFDLTLAPDLVHGIHVYDPLVWGESEVNRYGLSAYCADMLPEEIVGGVHPSASGRVRMYSATLPPVVDHDSGWECLHKSLQMLAATNRPRDAIFVGRNLVVGCAARDISSQLGHRSAGIVFSLAVRSVRILGDG